MVGLLLKEVLILRKYIRTLLIMIVFYGILQVMSEDSNFLNYMIILFAILLPMSTTGYDEQAKWETYAITLPIDKKDIIKSKYIFAIIALFVGSVTCFGMNSLINFIKGKTVGLEEFLVTWSLIGVALIFMAIIIPVIIKFGVEKGRFMIFPISILPIAVILILSKIPNVQRFFPSEETIIGAIKLLPFLGLIVFVLSYFICVRIYNKKEI